MSCTRFRTAISARLDSELPPDPSGPTPDRLAFDTGTLDAHLAGCADCRAFAAAAERLHRSMRLASAPVVPDLTPGILAAIGEERAAAPAPVGEPGQERTLRWILVVIAAVQIALAAPALLFGTDAGLPVHTARHLGSFDIALAVGLLVAAWRPERIPGILPIVAALVVCLVGSSVLDVLSGTTGAASEAHHATAFVGLVVVWLLSRCEVARRARRDANALRLA